MSAVGHLSNAALADFFTDDYDGGAAFVMLAHLSENNNHPELARTCAEKRWNRAAACWPSNALRLALQDIPTETITL